MCGLGPDLVGIHAISLAAAIELPRVRTRSNKDLRRSRQPERLILPLLLRSAPTGKRNFLLPPWLVAPRKRSILFVVWTAMANLMRYHRTRQTTYAGFCWTNLLVGLQGPGTHQSKLVSRASRPGLVVGFLRILCNGSCTAQRFHSEGDEQTCRIGCPDEPDFLSHYNECPLLYTLFCFRLLCFHGETIFSMT